MTLPGRVLQQIQEPGKAVESRDRSQTGGPLRGGVSVSDAARRIVHQLEISDGSVNIILVGRSELQRRIFLSTLVRSMPPNLEVRPFKLTPDSLNPYEEFQRISQRSSYLLVVSGLESLEEALRDQALGYLNRGRGALKHRLKLILWVEPSQLGALQRHAGDFVSWNSAFIELAGEPIRRLHPRVLPRSGRDFAPLQLLRPRGRATKAPRKPDVLEKQVFFPTALPPSLLPPTPPHSTDKGQVGPTGDWHGNPSIDLELRDSMIFQLLRRLSPVERQLFECYFVDELSPADCARRLNLEPGELMRQLEHIRTQAQHLRALPPAHP